MKVTEIILVLIWIAFFLLLGIDYPGNSQLFWLATIAFGTFYLFGSYKLFNSGNNSSLTFSIITGVALATSLITIPYNIVLENQTWLQILPLVNLLYILFLIVIIGLRRFKKVPVDSQLKAILLRTVPVLILTCFLAYPLRSNPIYQNTLIHVNAGNDYLVSNLKMNDLFDRTNEQLDLGNCEVAIELSIESFNEGLKWLNLNHDSLSESDKKHLWNIQGTYVNIYKGYVCKAQKLDGENKNWEALENYIKADSFLNINPAAVNDWERNIRAFSKNNIGLCYDQLNLHDSASIYFSKAIKYHLDSIREINSDLIAYFNNMSGSLSDSQYWNESNQIALKCLILLNSDSISENRNEGYSRAYLQLAYNAVAENKLIQAKEYLVQSENYLDPEQECRYYLFYSGLFHKQDSARQSIHYARQAKECFVSNYSSNFQNVAESYKMLFRAWMRVPNYDSALSNILKGMKITEANYGKQSTRYHSYLKNEADYYYFIGSYKKSLSRYQKIAKVYEQEFGTESVRIVDILTSIGRLKIELGAKGESLHYANESLRIAELYDFFYDDRATGILNDIAFIKYATGQSMAADSLYKKSIALSKQSKNDSSLTVASAINGLGLLAMQKFDYNQADSLYNLSLQILEKRLSSIHPDIGIVLMNKSELLIKRKSIEEARLTIEEAINNFIPFNRRNHPTVADMYIIKAVILTKLDQEVEAKQLMATALDIYKQNFDPEHPKIKQTMNLLAKIDAP